MQAKYNWVTELTWQVFSAIINTAEVYSQNSAQINNGWHDNQYCGSYLSDFCLSRASTGTGTKLVAYLSPSPTLFKHKMNIY